MEVETRKPVLNYVPVTMKPWHIDSKLQLDMMEIQPDIRETPPNNFEAKLPRCRKKKSIVWEHFTIETVRNGCRRAYCNICKQSFAYSTGSKLAGTSHLKRHIAKGTCSVALFNQKKNQSTPNSALSKTSNYSATPKQRYQTASVPDIVINSDHIRRELASMITMHEYPIHMVEHSGFVAFTQNIQPRFDSASFNTVQGDCVAIYLREKQNIQKVIDRMSGRVCLMLDLWSSCRNITYMFVTGQFVDGDWKLQRKLLNVIMEPYPDSDTAFSHSVAACLSDWNMDGKLFSVTINQPLSDFSVDKLRTMLCVRKPLLLHGQLLAQNCLARFLSSMVQDALTSLQGTVKKVRDCVKYVKISELHGNKFLDLKQQLQVPSAMSVAVDDQTKWNTTYAMLLAALELREIFTCLDSLDPDYKNSPSMEDWKDIETLCTCIKPLFETANLLATGESLTTNLFFHEVWKIQLELAHAATIEDPLIISLTKSMQEKFENYWNSSWIVLAIAVVMDPRFKMKLVEFSFSKNYGEEAAFYIKTIEDGIHELFLEYVSLPLPLTAAYVEEANGITVKLEDPHGIGISNNGLALTEFDVYIMETTSQQSKSELDQYLQESLLPCVDEFDVLGWWKMNCMKYPTLSKMACDILSISVCTVPASSVFDTKNKEMDSYRSSLRPETVEALICAKNWLESQQKAETPAPLVKMEVPA
ncbi:zinc finger BED domain-containing protein DAYSLEEPER-like [Primulina huaijiensis]|uniref:zinc finger BED domain-containing protein DAYSLEEPER-like n=1 Tax=Primulina huaijiensis TaxID=1492673 RepID=UPI003CC6FA57